MGELIYRTKGNADPAGKSRVYFTCHPDDFDLYFERICEELLDAADCAVYCSRDVRGALPEDEWELELERYNLVVIPVTFKLLTTPNRAMDAEFPFAIKKRIPVLPLLMEEGIENVYSRPDKFGDRQYLMPHSYDLTAISYQEKLRHYLDSVLISDEMAQRIRAAFDAYIFLSYRKKDRRYANQLMRLIHNNPGCRDIAIWFDEFLVPGENFREGIRKIMDRCDLVTLLVTPRILEKVGEEDGTEHDNYVLSVELPLAREQQEKRGINILSVEMEETDPDALNARDIPSCVKPEEEAFRERLLEVAERIARSDNDADPAHNFLIGLAYMDGIDVELDRERGMMLITGAAEQGLPEAMEELCDMYWNGMGVPMDYTRAAEWGKKLLELRERELGEDHKETLRTMDRVALLCSDAGDYPGALALHERELALRKNTFGPESDRLLVPMANLASLYSHMGQHNKALEMRQEVYETFCRTQGEEHQGTLLSAINLGKSYLEVCRYEEAELLVRKGHAGLCKTLGEHHAVSITAQSILGEILADRGDSQQAMELTLAAYAICEKNLGKSHLLTGKVLRKMARYSGDMGYFEKQLELQKEAYEVLKEALGEKHPDTLIAAIDLASAYVDQGGRERKTEYFKIAEEISREAQRCLEQLLGQDHQDAAGGLGVLAKALGGLGRHEEALELMEQEYMLMCRILGEKHVRSIIVLNNLSILYTDAKQFDKALKLQEKAYLLQRELLGEEHPETVTTLSNLAEAYLDVREVEKAIRYKKRAYEQFCRVCGEESPRTIRAMLSLAKLYAHVDDFKRMYKLMEKGYMLSRKVLGPDHPETVEVDETLRKVRLLMATKGRVKRIFPS